MPRQGVSLVAGRHRLHHDDPVGRMERQGECEQHGEKDANSPFHGEAMVPQASDSTKRGPLIRTTVPVPKAV